MAKPRSRVDALLDELCVEYGYCILGEDAEAFIANLPLMPRDASMPSFVPMVATRASSTSESGNSYTSASATGSSTMATVEGRSPVYRGFPPTSGDATRRRPA
jgi:hypothetical protein